LRQRTHARAHALVGWLSGRLDLSVRPCGRARGVAGVGVVYHTTSQGLWYCGIVHNQNRRSYTILRNRGDRENVVHIIMCTTYSTRILIMWYFYTLHDVLSTLPYITLSKCVHYLFCTLLMYKIF
jgi:hypothetical protein